MGDTPEPVPVKKASPDALPAMNEGAAKADGASSGVMECEKKKGWFAVLLSYVDEKNIESYLPDVTIDLKLPELGEVPKVTPNSAKPVRVDGLVAGGKGDVLQMTHDTNVYEAVGDFS